MKNRILFLIVGIAGVFTIYHFYFSSKNIVFPEGLELLCYGCEQSDLLENREMKDLKMVVYLEGGGFLHVYVDWEDFKTKYPEIEFLFYVYESDTSLLAQNAKLYQFNQPFYFDPENKFYIANEGRFDNNNEYNKIIFYFVKGKEILEVPKRFLIPTDIEGLISNFVKKHKSAIK